MFKRVHTLDGLLQVFMVRAIVFMEEQGIAHADEMDGNDLAAAHVLGEIGGEPVACGRIRYQGDRAFLQRLAVRRAWRGQGVGAKLLQFMLDQCRKDGFSNFELHAQTRATGFYRRHGFTACGEEFEEAGIPHVHMWLRDPAPQ